MSSPYRQSGTECFTIQADIDKILKIIQRKILKSTHLPVMIKEIQAGYLVSLYFKDTYLYLAQNNCLALRLQFKRWKPWQKIYTIRFPIV